MESEMFDDEIGIISQPDLIMDENVEATTSGDLSSIERALKIEEYKGKKQDREQRKDFAERIFSFLVFYMATVGVFVLLSGVALNIFHLSDTVLVTMLGTTTANVIGIFIVVAKYLFPQHKE